VFDPVGLLEGDFLAPELRGDTLLLRTRSTSDDIARVHDWAARAGVTAAAAGLRIAYAMACIVRKMIEAAPPAGLIVAGGETSGAICRTLELGALDVGRNIEPGVPICCSLGRFRLPVVLKSGNFGSSDFYGRAISKMKELL
jgi:uncharacterized protein YgbK (DUF1537 family)